MRQIPWILGLAMLVLLATACQGITTQEGDLESTFLAESQTEILPKTLGLAYKEEQFILAPQALEPSDLALSHFMGPKESKALSILPILALKKSGWMIYI